MTKPHEEEWSVDGSEIFIAPRNTLAEFFSGEEREARRADGSVPERDTERAQLAAQAPAMARLLLANEWVFDHCIGCNGQFPDHEVDCEFVAVLRAGGVLA